MKEETEQDGTEAELLTSLRGRGVRGVRVLSVGFGIRPEVGGGHPAPRRDVVEDDCTAAHGFLE